MTGDARARAVAAGVGALAVLGGHVAVLATIRFVEGGDPLITAARPVRTLLGLIQLLYVVPIAGILAWRWRLAAAGGALAVGGITLAVTLFALTL